MGWDTENMVWWLTKNPDQQNYHLLYTKYLVLKKIKFSRPLGLLWNLLLYSASEIANEWNLLVSNIQQNFLQ